MTGFGSEVASSGTHAQRVFGDALEQARGDYHDLALDQPVAASLGAWFLGPKAENEDLLAELVAAVVRRHAEERRALFPDDPLWISDEVKNSVAYQRSVALLRNHHGALLQRLSGSVPFFSYRYQAHMLWDVTLPALAGYFAAIFYNQNNVAAEASPVTTLLEMEVGDDLCRMLGYPVSERGVGGGGAVTPWGHITCDGTVANIEAMWAARNLKYFPLALAWALGHRPLLAPARGLTIRLGDGDQAVLAELDRWHLLNLRAEDVLAVPARLTGEYGISTATLEQALRNLTLQDLGFVTFSKRFLAGEDKQAVVLGPGTMHYSWPKAAALLGIGQENLVRIPVNLDARLDTTLLRSQLDTCLRIRRPVIMVVVVVGSTEESAVDPLADVIKLREEYRHDGLDFVVHVDGAWGGYFASLLRPASSPEEQATLSPAELRDVREFTPEMSMSSYVNAQYEALPEADSITVDPHKAGCVPYPAGGLCYRNSAMRNLVSFTAPIVYHGGVDPTVGVYGVEGSKPGAAAAGAYLSHRVIRTDRSGYGKILGRSLFNSKRFYAALITMCGDDDPFVVVPLQRLPAERENAPPAKVAEQRLFIAERIVPVSNDELLADSEAMRLFRELGSDQIILSYTFNFRTAAGTNSDVGRLNSDVGLLNSLTDAIFRKLSLSPDRDRVAQTPLFVTSSAFDPRVCGTALVDDFRRRLGVEGAPEVPILFLISTTMDPWLTDTVDGNFIPVIIEALRNTVLESIPAPSGGPAG